MKKVIFFLVAIILLICQIGYNNIARPNAFSYAAPGTINSCLLMVPETGYICKIYTLENYMDCCYPCLYQGGIIKFDTNLINQIKLNNTVQIIGPELHLVLECMNITQTNFLTKLFIESNDDIIILDNNYIYHLVLL